MQKNIVSFSVIVSVFILLNWGMNFGCQRHSSRQSITAPQPAAPLLLHLTNAKAVSLTVTAQSNEAGGTSSSQSFSAPTFPLNLNFSLTIPPCNYTITASSVLEDGSSDTASVGVDACNFGGAPITLAVVTEGAPTPTIAANSTASPIVAEIPTETPVATVTGTVTATPTALPTETPVPTALPTETPAPTALPTETPAPTALPTETPVPTALPTETATPTITATPTSTPTPTPTPVPTCAAAGSASANGHSFWYLSAQNQSCDTVCATHGGVNSTMQATVENDAGGGMVAYCDAVLTALGAPGATGSTKNWAGNGICVFDNTEPRTRARYGTMSNAPTSDGYPPGCRVCACSS